MALTERSIRAVEFCSLLSKLSRTWMLRLRSEAGASWATLSSTSAPESHHPIQRVSCTTRTASWHDMIGAYPSLCLRTGRALTRDASRS